MGIEYYFSSAMADEVLDGFNRNKTEIEISTDLNLSHHFYQLSANRLVLDDENSLSLDELRFIAKKKGRIFYLQDSSLQTLEVRADDYYKLVPTDAAPFLEINGVKMHISKGTCPFESATKMAKVVVRRGHRVLDTCGGLGYSAVGAQAMGASHVDTVEMSKEVLSLREKNPWSQKLNLEQATVVNTDVFAHIETIKNITFDSIVHDPPRFSLAGELYGQEFYEQLARVLKKRGALFHYTGNPFSVRSGDSFVTAVTKRLRRSGFTSVKSEPSLMGLIAIK